MGYEVFKRTSIRTEKPSLALAPDGRIALNAAATRLVREAGIRSVLLLWDQANQKIALKPAQKGDRNAYSISFTRRDSGSMRAKAFLSHIGWNAAKRETFSATWNPTERMLEAAISARRSRKDTV
jgi:hypothetical protein